MKKLSDQKIKALFGEKGKFVPFIKKKYGGLTDIQLSYSNGTYTANYGMVQVNQNIQNDGKFAVKGTDYNVMFDFTDWGGNSAEEKKVMAGVDLAPGETFTYTFTLNGFGTAAYNHTLNWTVSFDQKAGGSFDDLMKKAKFTGTEYQDFLKQAKGSSKK